jgi:hypothetical protein
VRRIPPDLSDHARTLVDQYAIGTAAIDRDRLPERLITRESGVAEMLTPPRSKLIGEQFFAGMLTRSGDLTDSIHRRARRARFQRPDHTR